MPYFCLFDLNIKVYTSILIVLLYEEMGIGQKIAENYSE